MKVLRPNKGFQENMIAYQPIDALLAVGLFCIICLVYALLAVLQGKYRVIEEHITLVGCLCNILMIMLAILLIKIRKEALSSIGLYKGNWKKSCSIGLLLAAILFFNNCLSHIIGGASFIATKEMLTLVVYYLTVAVCEEIVFRGYMGTRLYGLIKNPYLVIMASGVLFIVMHFPYRMLAYGMTISDMTIHNVGWILNLFMTHIVLSVIYYKTNSLYGSILPHWMSNLAYNLVAR